MRKEKYPYNIHINVLLLDDMIVNWKVGSTHWDTLYSAWNNRQYLWVIKSKEGDLNVDSITFKCNSVEENFDIFNRRAPEFCKRWEIHPKFKGNLPYKRSGNREIKDDG